MTTVEPGGAVAPGSRGGGSRGAYRATLISLAASALLLAVLYRRVDVRQIGEALLNADPIWLAVSIAAILPITLLRAVRFLWVAPAGSVPGIGEAIRLTLVASALNLFAPAKAGDLVKSHFVARRGDASAGVSLAIVVYERLCDLFGLIFWCVLGWAVGRPRVPALPAPFWTLLGVCGAVCAFLILSDRAATVLRGLVARLRLPGRLKGLPALAEGWPDLLALLRPRRRSIVLSSLALWLGHLVQIWLFTVALSIPVPFAICACLSAVALMAGQVPFTLAGVGARDVALVALMSPYMPEPAAAAMGILIATRGLVPALLGVPFLWPYLASLARGREPAPDARD
jgi:glycosyltransferase 2 family protein